MANDGLPERSGRRTRSPFAGLNPSSATCSAAIQKADCSDSTRLAPANSPPLACPRRSEVAAVPVNHIADRPGDVRASLADIGRAHEILGYRPTFDLERGLQRAVPWYVANWGA